MRLSYSREVPEAAGRRRSTAGGFEHLSGRTGRRERQAFTTASPGRIGPTHRMAHQISFHVRHHLLRLNFSRRRQRSPAATPRTNAPITAGRRPAPRLPADGGRSGGSPGSKTGGRGEHRPATPAAAAGPLPSHDSKAISGSDPQCHRISSRSERKTPNSAQKRQHAGSGWSSMNAMTEHGGHLGQTRFPAKAQSVLEGTALAGRLPASEGGSYVTAYRFSAT